MKKLNLAIAFILLIALISCNKNENIGDLDNTKLKTDYVNPYDSIGIIHNIGLEYVLSNNLLAENPSDMYEDMLKGIEDQGIIKKWPTFNVVDSIWSPIESSIISNSTYSLAICAQNLYNNGQINANQLNWFLKLDTIVSQKFGLLTYTSSIVAFDNDLHATTNLTNSQKTIIYIGSAIAKHSGEFWADYASQLKSTQYKWWQWGGIIGADIAGGIMGGGGGPGGSIGVGACCSALAMEVFSAD
jgi:hypothetical protein